MNGYKGNLIIAIDNSLVVQCSHIEATPSGLSVDNGKYQIDENGLSHAWRLDPDGQLPAKELSEKSKIGSIMLGLELAASTYEKESGRVAWKKSDSPAIFGASSLTLSLLQNRTSEDVDIALSSEFLEWWTKNGGPAENTDALPLEVFSFCGNWQSRAATIEGLNGMSFRVMHPLDTVVQKLLRIDPIKFDLKDKGDIKQILDKLKPSPETLTEMLTENHLRYRPPIIEPGAHFRPMIQMHEAMKRNTNWFLSTYLPEKSYEEINFLAENRHLKALGGLAAPVEKLPLPESIASILNARNIKTDPQTL